MMAFQVFEEISRLDSAAGWNVQLSCAFDPIGAWFPDEGAKEIFGQPDTILGGSFYPARRAIPVDGGYRVTGKTPFVSGAYQAQWFIGLANIFNDDTPMLDTMGVPVTLITATPASDVSIIDTWRTLGMRGTGSNDVMMTNVFVPKARTALLVPLETPGRAYQGPLYKFTIWASVAALASIATGIARAAIDDLRSLAMRKTPSYTTRSLRDRNIVQSSAGEAEATLGAARAYLYEALREVWNEALNHRMIDMAGKIKLQLAATHAVIAATKTVDLMHAAAGSTGIRDEHPFQRYFRDVHTITQHGFISASRYESVGQFLFDVPIEWPFFHL
jgi:alkylation response protein AidB-like acyl-CoA dehydrogenase